MEEFHGLGNSILDAPAARIIADGRLDVGIKIVADDKGRFLAAVAAHDDLTDAALITSQLDS